MPYEFDYVRIGSRFFPIMPFFVGDEKSFVPVEALVDSGATISLLNADVGRALGIEITEGEKFCPVGISGKITAYIHDVRLKIGEHEIRCRVAFTDELAVKINLLGREGVFENFSVLFNDKSKKVVLERI